MSPLGLGHLPQHGLGPLLWSGAGGWRGPCFTDEEAGPLGTLVMAERHGQE